jgi:O-antigen/teichoic acid export membrane protein
MLFPSIIMSPLYPVLARRRNEGAVLSPLLLQAVRAVLLTSLVITVPLVLFSDQFTRLFYGPTFAPAGPVVGIVCLAMIPISLTFVFGSLVAASGRQTKANPFLVVITIAHVAANFLAIPHYGVMGAAAVTVTTESLLALLNIWVSRDFIRWKAFGALALRLGAPVVAAVVVFFALARAMPFPFGPCVTLAVLGAGYVAFRVVTIEDFRRLTGFRKAAA